MDDQVCSEVHTFTRLQKENQDPEDQSFTARFVFTVPTDLLSDFDLSTQEPEYDSDGDMVVCRPGQAVEACLVISHELSTSLANVGRQVWKGSLLLADYILANTQMRSCSILELGSGTGLTSIVASFTGARVTATDINQPEILEKIHFNIHENKNLIKQQVLVASLDLTTGSYQDLGQSFDYIIAGDIVYDDNITNAFVDFIGKTLSLRESTTKESKVPVFLVALEKRFVFTLADLDTVAPAYDHFLQRLQSLTDIDAVDITFLPTDFTQHFCYERGDHLVLMQIKNRRQDIT